MNKVINDTKIVAENINRGAFSLGKGFISGLNEVYGTPITLEDLTLHLVTSEDANNAHKLDFYNPGDIWNSKGKVYFIIHGWKQSKNAPWVQNASRILVNKDPNNQVVQVDWEKPANILYAFSAFETESAGESEQIFKFLGESAHGS